MWCGVAGGATEARVVLWASGAAAIEPAMLHSAEAWCDGAIRYCPVCDGFEVINQAVGVIADGPTGVAEALYLRTFTDRLTVFMEQRTGAKFSYRPYKSGGEAATQLVGNHTESNVNNPSENLEVWRAGQVRALCVFDKERIAYKTKVTDTQSWNDIPTCKEQGRDVQYLMLRAFFLPGKVTPEQQALYGDLQK